MSSKPLIHTESSCCCSRLTCYPRCLGLNQFTSQAPGISPTVFLTMQWNKKYPPTGICWKKTTTASLLGFVSIRQRFCFTCLRFTTQMPLSWNQIHPFSINHAWSLSGSTGKIFWCHVYTWFWFRTVAPGQSSVVGLHNINRVRNSTNRWKDFVASASLENWQKVKTRLEKTDPQTKLVFVVSHLLCLKFCLFP